MLAHTATEATLPQRSARRIDRARAFTEVDYPEPHRERARRILSAHPEVRQLFGRAPVSGAIIVGVVALQLATAAALASAPWWLMIVMAFAVGAFANHALWVLIHECAHNLIARTKPVNRLLALVANIPIVVPAAESFRIYHLKHHKYQGDYWLDADLASAWEAKLVGRSFLGKLLWQTFFWVFQSLRVLRFARRSQISFFTPWVIANALFIVSADAAIFMLLGPKALAYLFLSLVFSIGPHPVGARWIQEHYLTFNDNQETGSYYGPLNVVALNVGYHNEHHDFPFIPWPSLPKLRALAPEMYDTLHYYTSWPKLWLRFLFDPSLSLFSRVTRDGSINARRGSVPFGARSEQY